MACHNALRYWGGILIQLYHCDGTENHMIITDTFWYVLDNV